MPQISRPCPICINQDSAFLFENIMASIGSLEMSYTVSCCNHCGFYFASGLADSNTFDAYYHSLSKYDIPGPLSTVDHSRIESAVCFLEKHVDKNVSIADLGCGNGYFLDALRSKGWQNIQGLDPAPNAGKTALDLFGSLEIRCGTLSNAHEVLNLQGIDVVCIMSVLEHLPDIRQDLSVLFSKLPQKCRLLIEVPAIEFFPNPQSEPFGEFSLEHIQFFDQSSLKNLMESLGAKQLAVELVELPMAGSGAVLGLFEWTGQIPADSAVTNQKTNFMEIYVEQSKRKLDLSLKKIPAGPLILFGAGSHTARLISHLEKMPGTFVHSIVDSNPNLIGKDIGPYTIKSPDSINDNPRIPVLVSSFRSQNTIASILQKSVSNPIVLMY
jgi:SAM-dependent methyltransferase